MRYFVHRGEETTEVEVTDAGVRIGASELNAHIEGVPGSERRHLRIGDAGVALTARRIGEAWLVQIEGRPVTLAVEDERTHAIRALAPAYRGQAVREVRAPMAGLVLRVEVSEGQHVEAGGGLVVIEAMKMENELRAEVAGVVASIEAREGTTVNPGDLLLTFAGDDE